MFCCSKIWEVDTTGRKITQISDSTVWEKQSQAFFVHMLDQAGTLFRGDKSGWVYLSLERCHQSTPDINTVVLYSLFISSYIPLATIGTGYTRKHKIPPVQDATSLLDTANQNRDFHVTQNLMQAPSQRSPEVIRKNHLPHLHFKFLILHWIKLSKT